MTICVTSSDCVGLIHPAIDAHTLGLVGLAAILHECRIACCQAGQEICRAVMQLEHSDAAGLLREWVITRRLTVLGFSYRLDPQDAVYYVARLAGFLRSNRLRTEEGGPIKAVFFAALPAACQKVHETVPDISGTFQGGETVVETLAILGVPLAAIPLTLQSGTAYDEARLSFGRELIRRGEYHRVRAVERSGYAGYGTTSDTVVARLSHGSQRALPPLMRAHVGPYLADTAEALRVFEEWTGTLAREGLLDVLSIGTSQLSQSEFEGDWQGKRDGGGVPIRTSREFADIWQAARPMLVRAYAGTSNVAQMARMFEETIHTAWHALSLWWFCQIDGRGPNSVLENLREHVAALAYIAERGKPFEANVAHHFAFRGGDDVTYVASACIAARLAKRMGIRTFILQIMLNTPRSTWGVQDLAKARAALRLLRELEDREFKVVLQPRAGLDYFSPDTETAKAQLAAATAMMDDIEPHDPSSPPVIHVVSYSEGSQLADPPIVNESIRIARQALHDYRALRLRGEIEDMAENPDVLRRTRELTSQMP